MPSLLWTSYLRYLRKNVWLLLLSLCAVSIGVAVILAIDVASISAKKSFALSMQALTGRSNYAITGGGEAIDEEFYRTLRLDWGVRGAAPVVEGYLSFPNPQEPDNPDKSIPLTLLGVDPFVDAQVRSWTGGRIRQSGTGASSGTSQLIGSSNKVVATEHTAEKLGWELGKSRLVLVGSKKKELVLAGTFKADSERSLAALDNLLLTDISVAQSVFERYGKLDRIDLIISEEQREQLEARLPDNLFLQQAGQSRRTAGELSAAFHVNLRALSYLCLLVATFLIFNVVSFSVSHRRQSLGRLRVLGVTGRELWWLLLGEALLLGAVASLLGCVLGLVLGRSLVPLVSRTLNDLYYVNAITKFSVDPLLLLKAYACGLLSCLVAAAVPATLAAGEEPLELLKRVTYSQNRVAVASYCFAGGLLALVAARGVLLHPSLQAGLFSLLLIVVGSSLLVPLLLHLFVSALSSVSRSVSARMAQRGISAFLGRTSIATVALTIAVAATVSIGMMVSSFRGTLVTWLETTLTADIYLSLRDRAGLNNGAYLPPQKVEEAVRLPGVRDWLGQRVKRVPSSTGETFLVGVRSNPDYRKSLVFLEESANSWDRFERGEGVFVTEPYARRADLQVGSSLRLASPTGEHSLPVLGVYYSYAPDRNMALLHIQRLRSDFQDAQLSGLGLFVTDDADLEEVVSEVKRTFGEQVEVRATRNLKLLALEIFERTFTVTEVLRFLALGVAFVGVFLSLLALSFERSQEVRVLRALGLGSRELFQLSIGQSLTLGTLSGLLAFPLGTVLSQVMISVINRRAFGWTITFQVDWGAAAESLLLALAASLVAGLYPAWKWSRESEGEALRERE